MFGRKQTEKPTGPSYDIPPEAKSRILATIEHYFEGDLVNCGIESYLAEVEGKLMRQHGYLSRSSFNAARASDVPVVEHFFSCDEDIAVKFLELTFSCEAFIGANELVDEINAIFREEGIGYQLTRYVKVPAPGVSRIMGVPVRGKAFRYDCPRIIRHDAQYEHEQIAAPALAVLADPLYAIANQELVAAHSYLRQHNWPAAITACGAAFESVLKTICDAKGWSYNADKDACKALILACKDNGLFPPFYATVLEGTGIVRNKMGDAHGRGPKRTYNVTKAHAEHMLRMTSSHIVLLVDLAAP